MFGRVKRPAVLAAARGLVGLAVCCAFGAASAREEVALGEEGTVLHLDDLWKRSASDPNRYHARLLGADFGLVMFPQRALLLEEEDHRRQLAEITTRMQRASGSAEVLPFAFERVTIAGVPALLGSQGVIGRESGLEFRYHVAIVSVDDLAYALTMWSLNAYAEAVEAECLRLARSLTFPGPDTAWAKRRVPREFSTSVHDHAVIVRARPTLLDAREAEQDALLTLESRSSELGVHVLAGRADDEDAMLTEALRVVGSSLKLEEGERFDLVVDGRAARSVVALRLNLGTGIQFVAIDLGEGRFVDLRIEYQRPPEGWSNLRRELIEGITIEEPQELDAWPTPIEEPAAPRGLLPAVSALVAGSATPRRIPPASVNVTVDEEGRLHGTADGRAWRERAGEEEVQWLGEATWVVPSGGGTFGLDSSGTVLVLGPEGGFVPLPATNPPAAAISGSRRAVLVVRDAARPPAPGFESALWLGRTELVALSASNGGVVDHEEPIEIAGVESIAGVAGSPDSARALLWTSRRFPNAEHDRLVEVDLETGQREDRGAWRRITRIGPADGGWLVTGSPEGGASGVHRLVDGVRELLVRGPSFRGVALREGRLLLQTDVRPMADGDADVVLDVSLELAREVGPRCGPLDATTVQELGVEAFRVLALDADSTAVLATLARIRAVAAAGRRLASAAGHFVGVRASDVDGMLHQAYGDPALRREGLLLLTAWCAEALLASGAEWVDGRTESPPRASAAAVWASPFTLAYPLHEVVASTVFDPDGWSAPTERLPNFGEGRTLLLGVDRRALLAAAADREVGGFERACEDADAATLSRLFEARPANVRLRGEAYRRLAGFREFDVLLALSAPYATREDSAFGDVRAWLSARVVLDRPEDEQALLVDALAAAARFPRSPATMLLLGRAWERSDDPLAREKAVACYRRALELKAEGGIADDAAAGIERLGG